VGLAQLPQVAFLGGHYLAGDLCHFPCGLNDSIVEMEKGQPIDVMILFCPQVAIAALGAGTNQCIGQGSSSPESWCK
jgi:hypothetical protein